MTTLKWEQESMLWTDKATSSLRGSELINLSWQFIMHTAWEESGGH